MARKTRATLSGHRTGAPSGSRRGTETMSRRSTGWMPMAASQSDSLTVLGTNGWGTGALTADIWRLLGGLTGSAPGFGLCRWTGARRDPALESRSAWYTDPATLAPARSRQTGSGSPTIRWNPAGPRFMSSRSRVTDPAQLAFGKCRTTAATIRDGAPMEKRFSTTSWTALWRW